MAELLSKAWIVCKAVAVPDNSEIIFEIFYIIHLADSKSISIEGRIFYGIDPIQKQNL